MEAALKKLKLGKSGGGDGLSPEHLVFGGSVLKAWLLNAIISCEQIPACLDQGGCHHPPVQLQGKGKDPLDPGSY